MFKRLALCASLILLAQQSHAGYLADQVPILLYGSTEIFFGVETPPADVCTYWGRHFKFDATTAGGKNMLSIALAAKIAGKEIEIWYTSSTAPGATQASGCASTTMAVVTNIGVK